jgi:hypothetical protein
MIMNSFQKFLSDAFKSLKSAGPIYTWITVWIFVGNFLGLFFINRFSDLQKIDYGQVIIWGLAIFLLGALIGIIFGVPKTISSPGMTAAVSVTPSAGTTKALNSSTTNLTEISDWLTKVVIGAGLVQLKQLPHFILQVANKMAIGISIKPGYVPTGMCAAIIIYYMCFGLLCGYFAMRTIFTEIFNKQF